MTDYRRDTPFEKCHICGVKMRGKFPVCRSCYRRYCAGGPAPEWLRFLINDLKREQRDDNRHAARNDPLDILP